MKKKCQDSSLGKPSGHRLGGSIHRSGLFMTFGQKFNGVVQATLYTSYMNLLILIFTSPCAVI